MNEHANPGLPRHVREALTKQVAQAPHPDADLLNAYAERALPPEDDAATAGHLAACRECREILFLSTGAMEFPQQENALREAPAPQAWWRWVMPAVATVAVVVAFLTIKPQGTTPQRSEKQEARVAPSQLNSDTQVAEKSLSTQAQPSVLAPTPSEKDAKAVEGPVKVTRRGTARRDALKGASLNGGLIVASPKPAPKSVSALSTQPTLTDAYLQSVANAKPATQMAVVKANGNATNVSSTEAGVGAMGTFTSDVEKKELGPTVASAATIASPSPKSSDAPADVTAEARSLQRGSEFSQMHKALHLAVPQRWRVSAQGHLERFVDDGWKKVSLAAHKSFRFKFVTALENYVWAVGNGPELYHSADGGENWNTLEVKTADGTRAGNIKSLSANDAQHLYITADDGTWVTTDGGQTWTKQ